MRGSGLGGCVVSLPFPPLLRAKLKEKKPLFGCAVAAVAAVDRGFLDDVGSGGSAAAAGVSKSLGSPE